MVEFRETRRSDGTCVLWVQGEFDLAVVDEFLEQALPCLAGADALKLDLAAAVLLPMYGFLRVPVLLLLLGPFVAFFGTGYFSGLGALVHVRNEAARQGKPMSLVNVSPATHRLLEITGLHQAFEIRPDDPETDDGG